MTPPRDPVLRAIYLVGKASGLTPTERLVLLALWRYLGKERKPIGPGLLADLVGTTRDTARNHLKSLRQKGYVGSSGSRGKKTGKVAERWLARKVSWPPKTARVGSGNPTPHGKGVGSGNPRGVGSGDPSKVGSGDTADLGVRQAGAPGEVPGDPREHHNNQTQDQGQIQDQNEEATVLITDLLIDAEGGA